MHGCSLKANMHGCCSPAHAGHRERHPRRASHWPEPCPKRRQGGAGEAQASKLAAGGGAWLQPFWARCTGLVFAAEKLPYRPPRLWPRTFKSPCPSAPVPLNYLASAAQQARGWQWPAHPARHHHKARPASVRPLDGQQRSTMPPSRNQHKRMRDSGVPGLGKACAVPYRTALIGHC